MGRGIKNASYKRQVLHNKDPYCWICGELLNGDMTLDHIIPQSKGGGNGPNLKLAHRRCNGTRGNTDAKVIIDWAFIYGLK
jgi:5-methylcytosine-specific restriction endonuclease McrA